MQPGSLRPCGPSWTADVPANPDRSWQAKVVIEAPSQDKPGQRNVVNFLTSAWVLGAEEYRDPTNPKRLYDESQHKLVKRVIQAPDTLALLARDSEAPSLFYGFVVYEWDHTDPRDPLLTVHYAYTKHSFRRRGMATELLRHAGWLPGMRIRFTHKCRYLDVTACHRWRAYYDEHAYKL